MGTGKSLTGWLGVSILLLAISVADVHGKKRGSPKDQEPSKNQAFGRVQVPITNTAVQLAAEFAVSELRNICEYCDDQTKASYEAMTVKELHGAETKSLTMMNGTMYILNATLQTSLPVMNRSEDNQILVVFQKQDGSYSAVSTERSPFLNH